MMKLYRRENGRVTHYHEAWASGSKIIEHWGELGTRGQQREHKVDRKLGKDRSIARVLEPAIQAGFEPIDRDGHELLLVEYTVQGFGTPPELEKRHALEDRLNETLGWTGVGHVDGGSIGSGTMEVACIVVDAAVAKRVIEVDLRDTPFCDYSRIFVETAD
ncbi:MAG TPA: hypothetical protein VGI81_10790 [Tepidisphaeraceae bacterium]|jgi:hypothetical protein